MTQEHTPWIDTRYWTAILLASVCGTNLGDLYAHESGLGIVKGLALLAVLTAGVFVAERFHRSQVEVFYWSVILLIRTGATNIADYLAYRVRVPALLLVLILVALYLVLATFTRSGTNDGQSEIAVAPKTRVAYWLTMLVAGVFGTAVGDLCENAAGDVGAAVGLVVFFAAMLAVVRGRAAREIGWYWIFVAIARTAGTAVGDLLSESKELHLGGWISTALSGAAFVGVLVFWRSRSLEAKLAGGAGSALAT